MLVVDSDGQPAFHHAFDFFLYQSSLFGIILSCLASLSGFVYSHF